MDECDLGARAADIFLKHSFEQMRAGRLVGNSKKECIDCGESIPEKRQKAVPGCIRCVDCESRLEQNQRR